MNHSIAQALSAKKVLALVISALALAGCSTDADLASDNLSQAADNFEVNRRIVFFNGITDKYLLTIEGRCSIAPDTANHKLDVTCKTGQNPDVFRKHFLGLSDNVTYFVEQVEDNAVSTNFYRVTFKPQSILPGGITPS